MQKMVEHCQYSRGNLWIDKLDLQEFNGESFYGVFGYSLTYMSELGFVGFIDFRSYFLLSGWFRLYTLLNSRLREPKLISRPIGKL